MVGHVSDFGLAKLLSNNNSGLSRSKSGSTTIGFKGTIGYAPPEYGMELAISKQGDVYSYGILVLEMFSGKRPTNEMFKDGLNLHNFVKRALPEGVFSVLDPLLVREETGAVPVTAQEEGGMNGIEEIVETSDNNSSGSEENVLTETEKKCVISVLETGVACSMGSANQRPNIADVLRKLVVVREALLADSIR
ncbi:unnamed protein product [Linum trigynum]|uniref:Protein kinase domain-containing protein n=1 Tax=Linum trigynum TaxID=586398 RepID=A0AAV2GVZ9_9ROSI